MSLIGEVVCWLGTKRLSLDLVSERERDVVDSIYSYCWSQELNVGMSPKN